MEILINNSKPKHQQSISKKHQSKRELKKLILNGSEPLRIDFIEKSLEAASKRFNEI